MLTEEIDQLADLCASDDERICSSLREQVARAIAELRRHRSRREAKIIAQRGWSNKPGDHRTVTSDETTEDIVYHLSDLIERLEKPTLWTHMEKLRSEIEIETAVLHLHCL